MKCKHYTDVCVQTVRDDPRGFSIKQWNMIVFYDAHHQLSSGIHAVASCEHLLTWPIVVPLA